MGKKTQKEHFYYITRGDIDYTLLEHSGDSVISTIFEVDGVRRSKGCGQNSWVKVVLECGSILTFAY